MKNTVVSALAAAILAAVLMSCFARAADYQSMTDEELLTEANAIKNEQVRRELIAGENPVIYDCDGVQAYLTGGCEFNGETMELEVVVINDSDIEISLLPDDSQVTINGWGCFRFGVRDSGAGKRKKAGMLINIGDSDITAYEEISHIEFSFYTIDPDTYKTISRGEPVTAYLNH